MDFIYFLGRFHVVVLHLPIGIILVAVLLETLARKEKFRYLDAAAPFLWSLAAITAVATVVLGYMHASEGGFEGRPVVLHRLYGTSVAVAACIIWWLRAKAVGAYRRVQTLAAAIIVILVVVAGHYGGDLTHGETYYEQFLPDSLRSLFGLESASCYAPPNTSIPNSCNISSSDMPVNTTRLSQLNQVANVDG